MTRFARAKGSKSSNERIPDVPTPWHVMKDQLESALTKEEPRSKTKTAKQLINEKDDLYYAKSLGNVNTDWAEFEDVKNKVNNIKSGKIDKKSKNNTKKLKKNLDKTILENEIISKTNNENTEYSKSLKTKYNSTNDESEKIQSSVESELKKIKKKKRKLSDEKISDQTSENIKQIVEIENSIDDGTNKNLDLNNKLSKRQKRNQKKQNNKSDSNEISTFNTKGNDWNNSVNCDQNEKFNENKETQFLERNKDQKDTEKSYSQNFKRNKLDRFGGSIPRKFQTKTAKIRDDKDHKRRKPDMGVSKVTINGMDVEIVKYDGFPVKKEDAERLIELRKEMVLKGIPKSDINAAMKLERRKCEKALARIRKQVCFHCRKAGHNLSDCPELGKEEAGTGICFKCGSTEHTHFECKVTRSDDYKFAKCFICREQGHIAKQCPDNPKGLYPDGGACKICGDVTHLKKDCPDLMKEKEETSITLGTIKDNNLELLGDEVSKIKPDLKSSKKVIKF